MVKIYQDLQRSYVNLDLINLVSYIDGNLYWKESVHNKCKKDSKLGTKHTLGYLKVQFNKQRYYVHRLIWEFFNGEIPCGYEVDHVDGNPSNNKIENLRLLTHTQNLHASRRLTKNTSGILGVSWCSSRSKWVASVKVKENHYRKRFNSIAEAQTFVLGIKEKILNGTI